MSRLHRSAMVAKSPQLLFDLVNEVERYPERFDWCEAASMQIESECVRVCRLDLRHKGIRTGFTTRNTLNAPHSIQLALVDGALSKLEGQWRFSPIGEHGCKIELELNFEFAGRLLGSAMALGFQSLADRMVDDFVRVARGLPEALAGAS